MPEPDFEPPKESIKLVGLDGKPLPIPPPSPRYFVRQEQYESIGGTETVRQEIEPVGDYGGYVIHEEIGVTLMNPGIVGGAPPRYVPYSQRRLVFPQGEYKLVGDLTDRVLKRDAIDKFLHSQGVELSEAPAWLRHGGMTEVKILPELYGLPLGDYVLAFLSAFNPRKVRVIPYDGEATTDGMTGRITISLNPDDTIASIRQEIGVGIGCGADVHSVVEDVRERQKEKHGRDPFLEVVRRLLMHALLEEFRGYDENSETVRQIWSESEQLWPLLTPLEQNAIRQLIEIIAAVVKAVHDEPDYEPAEESA